MFKWFWTLFSLGAPVSFIIDCKELTLVQTAQIDQLFQLLNLTGIHDDVVYGLPR